MSYKAEYDTLQYYNLKIEALEGLIRRTDPFSNEFEQLIHSLFSLQAVRDEQAHKVAAARVLEEMPGISK